MPEKNRFYRIALLVGILIVMSIIAMMTMGVLAAEPAAQPAHGSHGHDGQFAPTPAPTASQPTPGCQIQDYTLASKGAGAAFKEPDVVPSAGGTLTTTLTVRYADNVIGDCKVHLRSYNGKLVGPTLRAKPGDTLRITLKNELPLENDAGHVINTIGMLNHTNLHTHGLHVSPVGNSDNVLLDIEPQETFEYEIKIPPDHTPGTYWYHAHMHGSTATQDSSGMQGALIIDGRGVANVVDSLDAIKAANERVFVFQQVVYDEVGVIEPTAAGGGTFPSANPPGSITYFGPCNWEPMKREHTINGQLFPTLSMLIGEVQRWRMIDAGVRETIGVQLIGPYPLNANITTIDQVYNAQTNQPVAPGKFVKLHEIAVDGIALNKVDSWNQVELQPGYRSDVLVQVTAEGKYFLVDTSVNQPIAQQDLVTLSYPTPTVNNSSFSLTCPNDVEEPNFLATIKVSGISKATLDVTKLNDAMAKLPLPYKPIIAVNPAKTAPNAQGTPETINPFSEYGVVVLETLDGFQKVDFAVALHPAVYATQPPANPTSTPFPASVLFTAADHPFDPQNPRRLTLGNTEQWVLTTQQDSLYYAHPFHIHVNPFQTVRFGPDGKAETVWKDTIMVPMGLYTYVYTRYEDYIGSFVYHCHILDHEDQGMMEVVEIVNP